MHITASIVSSQKTAYLSVFTLSSATAKPTPNYNKFKINDNNTPQCILSLPFKAGTVIAIYTHTETDSDRYNTNTIQIDSYKLHISKAASPKNIMKISADLDHLSTDVYTNISSDLNSLSTDVYDEISADLDHLSADVYTNISSDLNSLSTDVYDEISSNVSSLNSFMSCLINNNAKLTLDSYTGTEQIFANKTLTEIVIILYSLICDISSHVSADYSNK